VLSEATVSRLPIVAADEREVLRRGGRGRERHDALLRELPALAALEVVAPRASRRSLRELRVVSWNVERGRFPEQSTALIRSAAADVALLTELDVGMARSGQRHTPRAISEPLGWGYAFGVEFLELGLGDAKEQQAFRGQQNEVGYHGGAVAAALPLERPALVRLETRGDWFGDERDEARIGGRMAILATLRLDATPVVVAAVHLESHTDPEDRAAQLGALLEAVDRYAPGAPALVGGDLNTFSVAASDFQRPELIQRALAEDPHRWRHPTAHEPLFAVAEAAGFDWRKGNVLGTSTHRASSPAPSARGAFKLDWFLARGLVTRHPEVLAAVNAAGEPLSDHEALAVTIALPGR
jgi:endonuclease/exonuclease/phosphatase family metal-dependent hydrolase